MPVFGLAGVILRMGLIPIGELDFEFVEAEIFHDGEGELDAGLDFGFDLRGHAEDVRVVLGEAADAEQAVEHAAAFVTIDGAELGTVYRYERSGVLHGLLRVRGFTQDDAHIFCMPSQIESEVEACVEFAFAVMKNFGFDKFEVELSDWDQAHPENYAGKAEDWHRATAALADTMKRMNIPYKKMEGEAAFYGPKLDVKLIDAIGRSWHLSTVPFDFYLPPRFALPYLPHTAANHHPLIHPPTPL